MQYFIRFLKPYRMTRVLIFFTVLLDVAGALLVPTVTAKMLNLARSRRRAYADPSRGSYHAVYLPDGRFRRFVGKLFCARLSAGWAGTCVWLSMKKPEFFRQRILSGSNSFYGNQNLNDINSIQTAFVMCIQMVLPVPIMCILGIVFAFRIHPSMGYLVTAIVIFRWQQVSLLSAGLLLSLNGFSGF